jgi:hypothetical protein
MPAAVGREGARSKRRARADAPGRAESVLFRHPSGLRAKRVKLGFAWDLFLFAGVFGIPLFLRGLPNWGAAILALWIADLMLGWAAPGVLRLPEQFALFAAFLGLQVWLGFKGNELTARACRARGWQPTDTRDAGVKRALERWGMAGD